MFGLGSSASEIGLKLVCLLLVLCSSYNSQSADGGFVCPRLCLCALTPGGAGIQLDCRFQVIDKYIDFTNLNDSRVKWLTIYCKNDFIRGRLQEAGFAGLPNLEFLSIQRCNFGTIPEKAFYGLSSLRNLTIDGSHVRMISSRSLDPLQNLEVLLLSHNNIVRFDEGQLCRLQKLQILNLDGNQLSSLSGLHLGCGAMNKTGNVTFQNEVRPGSKCRPCVPKLAELTLSNNPLSTIDVPFHEISPSLKGIHMKNASISFIARNFGAFDQLENIQVLDISGNLLRNVSLAWDQHIPSLQLLSLSQNQIATFSKNFFDKIPNVWYLDLNGNKLTADAILNASLVSLPSLAYLDIGNNPLGTLTENMLQNAKYLEDFRASQCSLSTIEDGALDAMINLQRLDLTHNNFRIISKGSLPPSTKLKYIDLRYNQLESVSAITSKTHPILTELYLAYNKLDRTPDFSSGFPALSVLDLQGNSIRDIEPYRFQGLQALSGLRMSNNLVEYIPRVAFTYCTSLVVLNLADNQIKNIEFGALLGLGKLLHLKLERNKITDLYVILSPLVSLTHLYVSHNEIGEIDFTMFPGSLKYIDLSFNHISRMGVGVFFHLHELLAVNLTYNRLATFTKDTLRIADVLWLKPQLFLRGNWIECQCSMGWILRINRYIGVSPRYMLVPDFSLLLCSVRLSPRWTPSIADMNANDFLCEYESACRTFNSECTCCDLSTNCSCYYSCPPECTCYHNIDYMINTVDCTSRGLTSLPVLTDPWLHEVRLDGNDVTVVSPFNPLDIEWLYLNKSSIDDLQPGAFDNLRRLRELYLQGNNIKMVANDTFGMVTTLEKLYLNDNRISFLAKGAFRHLFRLTELRLDGNALVSLDLKRLLVANSNLTRLSLHANPFICDCAFGPIFQTWLTENSDIIHNIREIKCLVKIHTNSTLVVYETVEDLLTNTTTANVTEQTLNLTLVKTNNPAVEAVIQVDFEPCFERYNTTILRIQEAKTKQMVASLSSMAILFLVVVAVVCVVYGHRTFIKVWVYAKYGKRLGFQRDEEEDDSSKPYDVYISYSPNDEGFVSHELAPKLEEGNPSYKLCLQYRDWPVGRPIADTIIAAVEQSRRTIIVLSDDYIRSEWCNYEFKMAHIQVLQDKQMRLIVVLVEDRPPPDIDQEMKYYIKTNTFIRWKDKWFWEKLRFYLPDKPRTPFGRGDRLELMNV